MKLLAGTSGYSYKEWNGYFYPDKTKPDAMLQLYAAKLPSVEINNTFYRMPRRSVLETWAGQVPDGFRFAIKASRRITHFKRLANVDEELDYLLTALDILGDKLGIVLFQLPPQLKKDVKRLAAFTRSLPPGFPAAFEFRHASWFDDEVIDTLAHASAAHCVADAEATGDDEYDWHALHKTAPFGYLRLRRASYSDEELAAWAERLRETGWEKAFVFFKHEDEAAGPRMAQRMLDVFNG